MYELTWIEALAITALVLAANYVAFGIPIARILRRAGFSGWWWLLMFGGPFMLIGLWVFAFRRWPVFEARTQDRI